MVGRPGNEATERSANRSESAPNEREGGERVHRRKERRETVERERERELTC